MKTKETRKPARDSRLRRWCVRGLVMVGLGGGFLVWINGPGLRWIAPMVVAHYGGKAGMRVEFEVEGTLSGGFLVKRARVESDGVMAAMRVGQVRPLYRFPEIVRGRLRGVEVDGVHVDLRMGLERAGPGEEGFDAKRLAGLLRQWQGVLVPYEISLRGVTMAAERDGMRVFAMGESGLRHEAGSDEFGISAGPLLDQSGRAWPGQDVTVGWGRERLAVDGVDVMPDVGVRDLVILFPEDGEVSAECDVLAGDAVFHVYAGAGLASAGVDLREGKLAVGWLAERLGVDVGWEADFTSISVELENLLPDFREATGVVRLLAENVVTGEWEVPELRVELGLESARSTLVAGGIALGSGFFLDAEAVVSREVGRIGIGGVRGSFRWDDVAAALVGLSEKVERIDAQAEVPASRVEGEFTMELEDWLPVRVSAEMALVPMDDPDAGEVRVGAGWTKDGVVEVRGGLEGVEISARYDTKRDVYQGKVVWDGFSSGSIVPWLRVFRMDRPEVHRVSGTWEGRGSVKRGEHKGELSLREWGVERVAGESVRVRGELGYDWPGSVEAKGVEVECAGQLVTAELRAGGGVLEIPDVRWVAGEREMASGRMVLPLPEDWTKWREGWMDDGRALDVRVESGVLPMEALVPWVPVVSRIEKGGTLRTEWKVGGTYVHPEIEGLVELKGLRVSGQAKMPPIGVRLEVAGKANRLKVAGSASGADLPTAGLRAEMPFRPAEWVKDGGALRGEEVSAVVDVPGIDLGRYAALVPMVRKLAGVASVRLEVGGVLAKPEWNGALGLREGMVELLDERVPVVTGITVGVDVRPERVVLREMRARAAGGTVDLTGTMDLVDGRPGDIDLRLTGRHVPLFRNDSMILRAHADLRMAGALGDAPLTGSVSLVDSLFYRDIEILPIGVPFLAPKVAALPRIDPAVNASGRWPEVISGRPMDVRLRTEKPFLIRGNIATGSVTGDVRVRGTVGKPEPEGTVEVVGLQAALPFSTLEVRKGTLRFTRETGLDPILEIRGTSNPRPYRVNGYVHGRMSDPQLVLTSSPPLPENEIMTLLATGTTTSGLENPQAAGSRALQLFAEEVRRGRYPVGRHLRPLLGQLDRFDFALAEGDPYSSDSYSTAMLALSDRWYLSAGMDGEGDSRFMVIWRLVFR